jgi:glycerol uptake facilitator-like aquaporin
MCKYTSLTMTASLLLQTFVVHLYTTGMTNTGVNPNRSLCPLGCMQSLTWQHFADVHRATAHRAAMLVQHIETSGQ